MRKVNLKITIDKLLPNTTLKYSTKMLTNSIHYMCRVILVQKTCFIVFNYAVYCYKLLLWY